MTEYIPQVWADGDPTKPPSAARFNYIEAGLAKASIVIAAALPASPGHGDEVYYKVAAGRLWHLVYDSTIVDDYKWVRLGGSDLFAEVEALDTSTSMAYVDLANPLTATVPLEGEYDIRLSARIAIATGGTHTAAIKIGAAATDDDDGIAVSFATSQGGLVPGGTIIRRPAIPAGAVLKLQHKSSGGNQILASHRRMVVRPVRVG